MLNNQQYRTWQWFCTQREASANSFAPPQVREKIWKNDVPRVEENSRVRVSARLASATKETRESAAVTSHRTGQACNILEVFAFEEPVSDVSFSFLHVVLPRAFERSAEPRRCKSFVRTITNEQVEIILGNDFSLLSADKKYRRIIYRSTLCRLKADQPPLVPLTDYAHDNFKFHHVWRFTMNNSTLQLVARFTDCSAIAETIDASCENSRRFIRKLGFIATYYFVMYFALVVRRFVKLLIVDLIQHLQIVRRIDRVDQSYRLRALVSLSRNCTLILSKFLRDSARLLGARGINVAPGILEFL